MLKPKEYNVADSNIALLGSDLEKSVKKAAAQTEAAWNNAGKVTGLQIWRIEKFQVKSWPKEQYGSFFSGDSYILLNTYKKPPADKLLFNVHFWLGKHTSQDEAGTAAYKTVELDDLLGGDPVQYREVQEHESDEFLKLFPKGIKIMEGGVDSGFKHVEPEKYTPRLLHLKGSKKVRCTQVDLQRDSLNSGDVFILDQGLTIFQFNGKKSGPMEKQKGAQMARSIKDERKALPKLIVLEEGEKGEDANAFWKFLGGEGPIKTAEEGGSDVEAEKEMAKIRKLFRLSDETGKMEFTLVSEGNAIKRNQLESKDVFIFDAGSEVYAWVGKGASKDEKKQALGQAQSYLTKYNRPAWIPIVRVLEGQEAETFNAHFH